MYVIFPQTIKETAKIGLRLIRQKIKPRIDAREIIFD